MGEQRGLAKADPADADAPSAETPESEVNNASSPLSVSGTSAGRGSTTLRPKRRARS